LQIISSLLKIQSNLIKDNKTLELLKSTQNRIKSMVVIHDRLYKSKDFARINFDEFIQSLSTHLFNSYGVDSKAIKINLDIKDVFLDINTAIPCGLIVNELLSNSLKYAFPDGKKGEISIAIHPLDKNEMELIVSDNGAGLPEEIDVKQTKSLGLHLVTILVEDQLQGDIKLDRTRGNTFLYTNKGESRKEITGKTRC
jgi:two-component sensor histidine kinase